MLPGLAGVTFLASWAQLFPQQLVENAYSRGVFPTISHVFGVMSAAIPFSWLDVWILVCGGILIYVVYQRRWGVLVGAASFFYLWFFWGWGLNYHRPPVATRLRLDTEELTKADFDRFADTAVARDQPALAAGFKGSR